MASQLPNCAVCRVRVQAGENVLFRPDGRVHHTECPKVICSICGGEVSPGQPIRRDGEQIVHGNCWIRRLRADERDSMR